MFVDHLTCLNSTSFTVICKLLPAEAKLFHNALIVTLKNKLSVNVYVMALNPDWGAVHSLPDEVKSQVKDEFELRNVHTRYVIDRNFSRFVPLYVYSSGRVLIEYKEASHRVDIESLVGILRVNKR